MELKPLETGIVSFVVTPIGTDAPAGLISGMATGLGTGASSKLICLVTSSNDGEVAFRAEDLIVLPNSAEFLPLLTATLDEVGAGLLVLDLMVEPNKEEEAAGFLAGEAVVDVEARLSQTSSTVFAFGAEEMGKMV